MIAEDPEDENDRLVAAAAVMFKNMTGEVENGNSVSTNIDVVDHSTPQGAATVAEAEKRGHKTFQASMLDGPGS